MYIFELPSRLEAGGIRVATLGSCRVYSPFTALEELGELKTCDQGLNFTHSIGEARQALETALGVKPVSREFSLYIHGTSDPPPTDRLQRTLAGGVDVFLLEVPAAGQFSCETIFLHRYFLDRQLIQPHRGALLSWYRALASAGSADESCVADTLEKMRQGGFAADDLIERLLRHMRLDWPDADEIERTLSEMMAMAGGRWIVVGAVCAPGANGAIMANRRALNAKLRQACERCGALFLDPSKLVEDHGAAVVFDRGGADIHEYAIRFYPTVGRAMLDSIAAACPSAGTREPAPAISLPERLNAELVTLHRSRLAELGEAGSGLYSHYERLLERNALVGRRDRAALALIDRHLPEYDAYAVMRAGLGEVAFLIAASGRRVTAHEPNANRRAAIEAGLTHLERAGLIESGVMSVVPDLTPTRPLAGRVLGVGLDASEFRDETAVAAHMDRVATFSGLLIDPRLFLRLREGWAEQDGLVAELATRGFGSRRDYFVDGLTWLRRV